MYSAGILRAYVFSLLAFFHQERRGNGRLKARHIARAASSRASRARKPKEAWIALFFPAIAAQLPAVALLILVFNGTDSFHGSSSYQTAASTPAANRSRPRCLAENVPETGRALVQSSRGNKARSFPPSCLCPHLDSGKRERRKKAEALRLCGFSARLRPRNAPRRTAEKTCRRRRGQRQVCE